MIKRLYEYFTGRPQKLPGEFAAICETEGKDRATLDYIAGMSDYYAIETFQRLFVPRVGAVSIVLDHSGKIKRWYDEIRRCGLWHVCRRAS